jgi:cobaltochelatase CobT
VSTLAQRKQQVEELCAASIRALTGERRLHFRAQQLHLGSRVLPLPASHLHPRLEQDDFKSFRGTADAQALRINLSDATLHRNLRPSNRIECVIFELLEQFRVESLVPEVWPGVRSNVAHRFEQWSIEFLNSRLFESHRGILLFTLIQLSRARVTAEPILEAATDPIETTRGHLVSVMGHDLAGLRRNRTNQAEYARHALAICVKANAMLAGDDRETEDEGNATSATTSSAFTLVMGYETEHGDGIGQVESRRNSMLADSIDSYRVFTRAYDRECGAASLIRPALIREYREQLDASIAAQGINLPRLAHELKAILARPEIDDWESAREEGLLDGRCLAQLVASPTERRLFRGERMVPRVRCVVTFLVDCSGSMKSTINNVAMLIDVLVRALEDAGAASEVLGFTTNTWNGGRAAQDWLNAGCPAHPGRLNEACHIVFKSADTQWRRGRASIAALLKSDLFREGIDGEAINWACARLAAREEERRILLVISDGSPMDSATQRANDAFYLDHHLRNVIQLHEQGGSIEIAGLGVGLDLSRYYERCRALNLDVSPSNAVMRDVINLFTERGKH